MLNVQKSNNLILNSIVHCDNITEEMWTIYYIVHISSVDTTIEMVYVNNCLGVLIDHKLKWKEHIKNDHNHLNYLKPSQLWTEPNNIF